MAEAAATMSWPGTALFARLARRPALSLLVLCLLVWLPGILVLPPLDRDESRFAQASKQMIETGDIVDIRFSTGVRYNKPVGIYWLQAAATKVFGSPPYDRIWTYRVPSLIGGYLAVLLLFGLARAFAPAETALAAAALLGATVLMTAETQIATTDAVLLACTLGAQSVLFRLYLSDREKNRAPPAFALLLAGWFAFAFGVLVKGPVIVAVLGVTALVVSLWDRKWLWLKKTRPMLGLLIIALVVLPWLVAIAIHSHGTFFRQSLGHDFGDKLVGGQESHGAPPGYYLLLATLTLWPAVLFVLPAVRAAWIRRAAPAMRYLLAWSGATWLMIELTPTKLPHYILPAYPALALLAACWVFEGPRVVGARPDRILRMIAVIQFAVGAIAIVAVAGMAPMFLGGVLVWYLVPLACVGGVLGGLAVLAMRADRRPRAMMASVAAAAVLIPMLTAGAAPSLDALWVSPRLARLVARDRRSGDPPPIIAGYVEPSLIFLLGTDTRIGTGEGAAQIAVQQGGLALVEDRERGTFLTGLAARDTSAFPIDALWGYDYSHGRKVHITIYRVAAQLPGKA